MPDVVLIGKALGNGFPVSGVVASRAYPVTKAMLPGSTFAGNPLAAAAVAASLARIRALDLPARVAAIEETIVASFGPLAATGVVLRGRGALWVLELPRGVGCRGDRHPDLPARGGGRVRGRYLRILPAATIETGRLAAACTIVREELTHHS